MPRVFDHLVKSLIRLVRQSTTVPNTSNTNAFTAAISDMLTPFFSFGSSFRGDANGSGLLAGPMTGSASNPESRGSGFALRAPRNDVVLLNCARPLRALRRKIVAVGLAQLDLAQLAGRSHRHLVENPDHLRHLEAAQRLAAVLGDVGLARLRAGLQLDEGGNRLAPLRMRQPDHCGVLHRRMG